MSETPAPYDPQHQPRKPRKPKTPATVTPIPEAFTRSATRHASITNPMRARFRALQLLDTADPDIVNAAALVLMQRYAGIPAMQSFVGDIWCSCMAWSEEWNVTRP